MSLLRFRAAALASVAVTACLLAATAPASAGSTQLDHHHAAVAAAAHGPACDELKAVPAGHVPLCTHGPDRLKAVSGTGGQTPAAAPAAAGQLCFDGGVDGPRIEVLYGIPLDRPNRYSSMLDTMQAVLAQVDANLEASDAGTSQHYRFLCEDGVDVTIRDVTLLPVGDDASFTYEDYVSSVANQVERGLGPVNFADPSRIYLAFVDQITDVYPYGGQASVYSDDRKDPAANFNNVPMAAKFSMTAYYDAGVVGHEIGHNIGAVQMSAPHSSGGFHCHDEYDLMCYNDGGSYFLNGGQLTFPCDPSQAALMDCGHDDYYSAAPEADNYLATHWNTADSSFLTPLTQVGNVTLSVSTVGTGTGTVTSYPAGISCGATCIADFPVGASVTLTATAGSDSLFSGWSGACTGTSTTCTLDLDAAKETVATFTANTGGTLYEETSATLDGWAPFTDSLGGYRASPTAANTARLTFRGTTVTWLTRKGPAHGKARVLIDGVDRGVFDTYASTNQSSAVSFGGLSAGPHTIVVRVLGAKNTAATGTYVAVDGFKVGTTTVQETSTRVTYGKWKGVRNASTSGGSHRTTAAAGSTASFAFTGTAVDWVTTTGPGRGKAEVIIDGVGRGVVDLYAASVHYQVRKAYSGLGAGPHTITVKVLGARNPYATASAVSVDGFVVH